jgi:hypothetical protein
VWTCDPGPGEGSFCTTDVGDLAPGQAVTVDFPVLVNQGTPDNWEVFNEVFVDSHTLSASQPLLPATTIRSTTGGVPTSSARAGDARVPRPRQAETFISFDFLVTLSHDLQDLGLGVGCCFSLIWGDCTFFNSGDPDDSDDDYGEICATLLGIEDPTDLCPEPAEASLSTRRQRVLSPPADRAIDAPLLFRLRDRIFRRTPGGRRATALSVDHIADLGATGEESPDARDRALDWYLGWQPLLRRLIDGRGDTVTITAGHTQLLIDYVASLKAAATTPALLDALELEEARLGIPGWVGLDMDEWLEAINVLSCEPSDTVLCLQDGRFRVEAEWLTVAGEQGHGHAVQLTPDTGYFWFFDAANVEMVTKVVPNGCGLAPGHPLRNYWLFSAGLTDVDVLLTVTDTDTGSVREYRNPQKTPFQPIQDTGAFPTCDAPALPRAAAASIASLDLPHPPIPRHADEEDGFLDRVLDTLRDFVGLGAAPARSRTELHARSSCVASATTLCLDGDRFAVTATWRTVGGATGAGQAVELTDDTGYFWFFDDANVEVVTKTHDACGFPQGNPLRNFWVFAAGLTDVEVDLRVEDTVTGEVRVYHNDQKTRFQPIQDTAAFPTCDA